MTNLLPKSFFYPDLYMLWNKSDAENLAIAIEESAALQNELSNEYLRIATILENAHAEILMARRNDSDASLKAIENNFNALNKITTWGIAQGHKVIARAETTIPLNKLIDSAHETSSSLKDSPIWLVLQDRKWKTHSGYEQPQGEKVIRLWVNGKELDLCEADEWVNCHRHKHTIPIAILLTWCLNKGHDMTLSKASRHEDDLVSFLGARLNQSNDTIYKTLNRLGINNSTFN
ncbi:hypothetical protein [Vibrio splendidus]|uniref:hypothetical protein n=1 Tax=Vibrio splendidus TaxID=29497 RepID=UPI000D398D88|nr:hypothetical protein [Vibrio splendidus]PTP76046.1 hypothetical protein CWO06_11110 [Vibrio splendidus]